MNSRKKMGLVLVVGMLLNGSAFVFGAESADKAAATKVVEAAVMAAHPGAKITSAKPEKEEIDQFEVEFTADGKKMSADVAPDGTIIETEEPVKEAQVPAAAREAIQKAAEGAAIKSYAKITVTANVDKEKNSATKLDKPMMHYEAGLSKDGMKAEVEVDDSGKVIEAPEWKKAKESK